MEVAPGLIVWKDTSASCRARNCRRFSLGLSAQMFHELCGFAEARNLFGRESSNCGGKSFYAPSAALLHDLDPFFRGFDYNRAPVLLIGSSVYEFGA